MFYVLAVTTPLLLLAGVTAYVLSTFISLLLRQGLSPLRDLRGPASPSFFTGNLREMHDQENNDLIARWEEQYGSTFVYRGFMGGRRLMTTDPLAVGHIMGRGYDYPKPDFVRDNLASMAVGKEGLLTVEGEDHRRQRRILTQAFTSSHIKTLSPVFWAKAVELRGVLLDSSFSSSRNAAPADPFAAGLSSRENDVQGLRSTSSVTSSFLLNPFSSFLPSKSIARHKKKAVSLAATDPAPYPRPPHSEGSSSLPGLPEVDVLAWLSRATLDVIGEAGFGYHFNSVATAARGTRDESELARAFGIIFDSARKFRTLTILQAWFPVLSKFRRNSAVEREARNVMHSIGRSLISERQAAILAEQAGEPRSDSQSIKIEDDGRDLLTVLIRSNMSSVPAQRLTPTETLCQISTFLSAGHETISCALAWALYALARAPSVQGKLRDELRAIPFDLEYFNPSSTLPRSLFDDILNQPYLDYVVRESLRLHAPVTATMRVAGIDDMVPVSRPFVDRHGRECTVIRIKKGDIITIPFQAMNKDRDVWGEDAYEFRPERWESLSTDENGECEDEPKQNRAQRRARGPGLWGGMMTFGNSNPTNGNRACIGYRFAINEMKIFLFALIHDIEFSLDPSIEIEKKINVVTRPSVKSEPDMGNQMPLRIRRVPEHEEFIHTAA
ncbi:cytochrome P450 [Laetiporus sulphureus 93-53]|uniref:Cytochrome P450 n=1 Tax=Laetiporus sulphureus 93-53 TaxID=1314785 RepID=A0A165FK32_9APHY|nr:cytochrome P450 [Laetiporus sulphureus 93-53]KZT09092.1 cytochrome P450 [Laetiporus sulphureus 93-53]